MISNISFPVNFDCNIEDFLLKDENETGDSFNPQKGMDILNSSLDLN